MSFGKGLHQAIFSQDILTIKIAGEDVPIRFGIQALEEIEEKYGTLEEYEHLLKGIKSKKGLKKSDTAPVMDGLIAMIHCGCRARGYDLTGVTDDEILGAVDLIFPKLRTLVIVEFNRNFIELDDDEKK